MKSMERQSPDAIRQFKLDTIELNKAINKFVTEEPVPGTNIGLSTFLKSHLLFDYHIQYWLELCETLGGVGRKTLRALTRYSTN